MKFWETIRQIITLRKNNDMHYRWSFGLGFRLPSFHKENQNEKNRSDSNTDDVSGSKLGT